jgi:DNA-binding CsgD family transcriptional regulator
MATIPSQSQSQVSVVVDARCRIRYVSLRDDDSQGDLDLILESRSKLQPDVETFVRGLAAERDEDAAPVRIGVLNGDRVLRAVRVVGSDGTLFILNVEEDLNSTSLMRAARRHQLTRRETQVLSLILDGSSAGEISQMLALSEHTVQGYFKRLLFKTGARNRVSMAASIFNWDTQRGRARAIGDAVPTDVALGIVQPMQQRSA